VRRSITRSNSSGPRRKQQRATTAPVRQRRRRDQRRCWLPLAGGCSRRELLAPSCLPRAIQADPREPENHLDRSGRYRRDLPDHGGRQSEQARARQSALPSHGTGDRQPRDFNGDHGPTLSSSRFPRASSTGLAPKWSVFLIEFHGVDGLSPASRISQGLRRSSPRSSRLTVPRSAAPGVGRPDLPRVTLRLGSLGAGWRWRRRPSVQI
jgi:hypothetical protein